MNAAKVVVMNAAKVVLMNAAKVVLMNAANRRAAKSAEMGARHRSVRCARVRPRRFRHRIHIVCRGLA